MRVVLVLSLVAGVAASATRAGAPSIKRVETVGATGLVAPVGTPYVAPGQTKEYSIYGQWVDWASEVKLNGVVQPIVEKKMLFNADGALLRVKLSVAPGTDRGLRTLSVKIECPWVSTDCVNTTLHRSVMVLRVGTISRVDPNSGVAAKQLANFTVTGSGLDVAKLHFRTMIQQSGTATRQSGSFAFSGTPACGLNVVMLRDEAEGGDFYPYNGVLNVSTTTSCGYTPPPRTMNYISCPTGEVYDANTKTCYKP